MSDKIYSFIGLATKAGKLVSGEDGCERAIKGGKANLVIVAEDASDNTKKAFNDACKYRNVAIKFFGTKEFLGRYTGKKIRAVVAIIDNGFAKHLIEMLNVRSQEDGGGQFGKIQGI
jgi:ribosomal protein L7Ae-like RNA K-turn-binding protein